MVQQWFIMLQLLTGSLSHTATALTSFKSCSLPLASLGLQLIMLSCYFYSLGATPPLVVSLKLVHTLVSWPFIKLSSLILLSVPSISCYNIIWYQYCGDIFRMWRAKIVLIIYSRGNKTDWLQRNEIKSYTRLLMDNIGCEKTVEKYLQHSETKNENTKKKQNIPES